MRQLSDFEVGGRVRWGQHAATVVSQGCCRMVVIELDSGTETVCLKVDELEPINNGSSHGDCGERRRQ